jgi:hypothetical protein
MEPRAISNWSGFSVRSNSHAFADLCAPQRLCGARPFYRRRPPLTMINIFTESVRRGNFAYLDYFAISACGIALA